MKNEEENINSAIAAILERAQQNGTIAEAFQFMAYNICVSILTITDTKQQAQKILTKLMKEAYETADRIADKHKHEIRRKK